jgi:hypothetical protein
MPLYWTYLMMGAVSSDKTHYSASENDMALLRMAKERKRMKEMQRG